MNVNQKISFQDNVTMSWNKISYTRNDCKSSRVNHYILIIIKCFFLLFLSLFAILTDAFSRFDIRSIHGVVSDACLRSGCRWAEKWRNRKLTRCSRSSNVILLFVNLPSFDISYFRSYSRFFFFFFFFST